MKALVTGAAGFIGSHIVERLLAQGHQVRAFVRPTSDCSLLEGLDAELARGDVTDVESLRAAMSGIDTVFHAAANVSNWGPWKEFEAVTVRGTENTLRAAAEAGVGRFLQVSTNGVYDDRVRKRQRLDESTPFTTGPSAFGHYSLSKARAEKAAFRYHAEGALAVSAIRPGWVYGPRDRNFVPYMVDFVRGPLAAWVGNRDPILCPVYVTDVADLAIAAATLEPAVGQAYNVAFDQEVRLREFLTALCRELGLRPPRRSIPYAVVWALTYLSEGWAWLIRAKEAPTLTRAALYTMTENDHMDVSKAKRELGWSPKVGLQEGVRLTAEWMRSEGLA